MNLCRRCGGSCASITFTVTAEGNPDPLRPLIVGDYCSASCLSKRLQEVCPRPDFDGTHAELDRVLEEQELDEAADAGAYDPPGAAYVRALGGGGRRRFALPSRRAAS